MNRAVGIIWIAFCLTVLGFACQNPVSADRDTGSMVISIVDSVGTSNVIEPIEPPLEMVIATYRIELTGPGNTQSIVVNAGGGPASFQSLRPGTWTVTVNGRNSGGVIVGSGTKDVPVNGGQNASVTIDVVPLSGEGTLQLSLTWPQDWNPAAEVEAVLTPAGGAKEDEVDISDQFSVGGSSSQPVATYSGSWSAGYYYLNLALLDGSHRLWELPPISVRIVEGQLSLGEYELTVSDLNLVGVEVNVGADLNNPYTVSFDGVLSEFEYGQNMTVEMTLDPPLPPDEVRWFLGSTEILQAAGEHSITIGPDGVAVSPGRHWLGVLVRRGTMLSSRAVAFQVTPPDNGGEWSGTIPTPAIGEYVLAGRWQSTDPDDQFVLLSELASPPLDPSGVPDDSYFSYQWHLSELNMPQVWKQVTGNPSVIVAIIDTGIAESLSDLQGTSFVPGWNTAQDNHNSDDQFGHGTMIAGVIAQTTNNDFGAAGMAHGVSLMPIRILASGPGGLDPLIATTLAIQWAVDNGAHIINLSLGEALGTGPDDPLLLALFDAIEYAASNGVTIVAAAGNIEPPANPDDPEVPDVSLIAAHEHTLAVGATLPGGARAAYSSWGPGNEVDVMAPGGCDIDDLVDNDGECGILQQATGTIVTPPFFVPLAGDSENFVFSRGTSLAAPQVTALAALLKSLNSELTPAEIRSIITGTADPIAGDPQQTGAGIINPLAAVLAVDPLYHLGERWVDRTAGVPAAAEQWRMRGDSGARKMSGPVDLLLRYNLTSDTMEISVIDRHQDTVAAAQGAPGVQELMLQFEFDPQRAPYTIEVVRVTP